MLRFLRLSQGTISKTLGIILSLNALLLGGCSLYRPELRQGDYITQAELDKLQPGMAKIQVQQILGSPALNQVLEVEHWNYTYAYLDGRHRSQPLAFQTITLYFKNDRLQGYASKHWHPANLPAIK